MSSSESSDDPSFEAARLAAIGVHGAGSIDRVYDDYYWCELCGLKVPARFRTSHEKFCTARHAVGDDSQLTAVKVEPGDDSRLTAVKVEPCDDSLTAVNVEPRDDDLTAVKAEPCDDDPHVFRRKAFIDPKDLASDDDSDMPPDTPEGEDDQDMPPDTPEGDDPPTPPNIAEKLDDAPWRRTRDHDQASGSRDKLPTQQHGKKIWGSKRAGGARVQAGRALRNAEVDMIGEADGSPDLEALLGEVWPEQFKMVTQRLSASRDDAAETLRIFLGLGKEFRAALCRTMVDRSLHEEPIAYLK